MKSHIHYRGTVIIGATVAAHLRAFHLPWARYLRGQGFRVYGVARDITGCVECQEGLDRVVDIPFSRNGLSLIQQSLAAVKLRGLRENSQASLVHFHTPNAAFWGRLALRKDVRQGRCKVAYTSHGFHFHQNGGRLPNAVYRSAEKLAGRYTHALLTINSEDAAAASRFTLAPGGFHELLPGAGVDLHRFDPQRLNSAECHATVAGSLGLPEASRFVLMVAEFSVGKRHRDAVDAFARLNLPGTYLLFAGSGSEEFRARELVRKWGLDDRVHFLGYRKEVPELLAASDAVILPSEREGLPVSIMEAMAMEKPVIVADARGSRDLVKPDCGWVHAIGNTGELASLLGEVLGDPKAATRRAQRGRERVISKYAWPAVEQKLIHVYRRLGIQLATSGAVEAGASVETQRARFNEPERAENRVKSL